MGVSIVALITLEENKMNYETELKKIIKEDEHIMSILEAVGRLPLPDAWVSAGLIRNKLWDVMHGIETPIHDKDVIYYDSGDFSLATEKALEHALAALLTNEPWSVKNQARMHLKNGFPPFASSYDGVAHFTETPTAVAVRLYKGELEIMAPYGLADLFEKKVRPTPYFHHDGSCWPVYSKRMEEKRWDQIWTGLSIEG